MKVMKRKDVTFETKRRKKGVENKLHSTNLSNESVSAKLGVKRTKLSDGRKRKKDMAEQVDLSNVSNELEIEVGIKKKDVGVRKKKKQNKQKIEPEENQKHNEKLENDIVEGTNESEKLVQNKMEEEVEIRKEDVGLRKDKKKRKDQKFVAEEEVEIRKEDVGLRKDKKKRKDQKFIAEEEQKCDDGMEGDIGEGNIGENGKMKQKQRKANKKKKRNEMTTTEVNAVRKIKKNREARTVEHLQPEGEHDLLLEKKEDEEEIYQIPSEDENLQGTRKWITEYYQSRPGLNVLQERIDDFITAHEAQEEQARIEREEKAADGGWTVVVHHKGRKKTTDAESGIAVGSVAQAAVMDKMNKKKIKDVGDFYRFQKREANRNEIAMLQSKFEQDKKRMQELRAQRKFRPY